MSETKIQKVKLAIAKILNEPEKNTSIGSKSDDFARWDSLAHIRIILEIEKISVVGKNNFSPPPKVDSVILKISKKTTIDKKLISLINHLFSYRRKTVKNILKQFNKQSTIEKRIDDLSGDEIVNLAKQILKK